jgi:hypothetical protein
VRKNRDVVSGASTLSLSLTDVLQLSPQTKSPGPSIAERTFINSSDAASAWIPARTGPYTDRPWADGLRAASHGVCATTPWLSCPTSARLLCPIWHAPTDGLCSAGSRSSIRRCAGSIRRCACLRCSGPCRPAGEDLPRLWRDTGESQGQLPHEGFSL